MCTEKVKGSAHEAAAVGVRVSEVEHLAERVVPPKRPPGDDVRVGRPSRAGVVVEVVLRAAGAGTRNMPEVKLCEAGLAAQQLINQLEGPGWPEELVEEPGVIAEQRWDVGGTAVGGSWLCD